MKMPSKKQYNLVTNDELDIRVPLHTDEAFEHGIKFSSKYIGTLDVPRPTSRVEIVAAMRRIRYEFKAKGIKKKKVTLEVSVDGVKVTLRKKKKNVDLDDSQLLIMSHPIYRIFYVSHDSQDLKIFSYIARDASSNVFRCHVFKANKKNQAMRIVRTIGQAFEVCHKMAVKEKSPSPEPHIDEISQGCSDASSDKPKKDEAESESGQEDLVTLCSNNEEFEDITPSRPSHIEPLAPPIGSHINKKGMGETFTSPLSDPLPFGDNLVQPGTPLSMHHEVQLMREQLEQQQQQTQAAVAQVHLLRDQLAAETAARLEAQARAHQLLVHNKELIEHIQQLVIQIREIEIKRQSKSPINQHKVYNCKEVPNQLTSPPVEVENPSVSWLSHMQRLNQQTSVHTLLSSASSYPPDTPSSVQPAAAHAFLFPPPVAASSRLLSPPTVPKSRDLSPREGSSPIIFPLPMVNESDMSADVTLPIPRQEAGHRLLQSNDLKYPYEDKSSTPSLSSESDPKYSSNQSSAEMLLPASLGQLYPLDPWRLPQVPEDSVPLPPYGPAPLGVDRGQNISAITRAASERYSRQETLAHLQRMAWARHTTK